MARREVRVRDYVGPLVPMLARMYQKRLAGSQAIGYTVAGSADNTAAAVLD